jgi:benzoyl-CoA reductase/2-hydroxyglutaryl-CoA dehydratase subunit BcrC/BadD/HgdB
VLDEPRKISLVEWDRRYYELRRCGLSEPDYGGLISRHITDGDHRLTKLNFDNSAAALRLWNLLLTEENRLAEARGRGKKLVGVMKDLGTVPVMACSLETIVPFYPDGAWWIPCMTELNDKLFEAAAAIGVDESFCPVRAMLGAFVTGTRFPIPERLICSTGATCDDFSAIAQRLEALGHSILWWEIPHRRHPEPNEQSVLLPGGLEAPACQVGFVKAELERISKTLEELAGRRIDNEKLFLGIKKANIVRKCLDELRYIVFTAYACPLPALEVLIAEMLAIHFCSDIEETTVVLQGLVEEVRMRAEARQGVLPPDAVRVFWVNPVADLKVMNLLEDCGGRLCGTEFLFIHALEIIPEDLEPMEALARMALSDPMVGSSADRAERICSDIRRFGAEAVVVSRIPGASHCAVEGKIISDIVRRRLELPVVEIEVPPVSDSFQATLRTRLEALVETAIERRKK